MKAIIKPGYTSKRIALKDAIPVAAPFTLFISPSQHCNFRCSYCAQSLNDEHRAQKDLKRIHLTIELFNQIVEQSQKFPVKYKRILLTGLGEPLMNKNITHMVKALHDAKVSENLEIFTNASLLTPELSKKLIDAGLTKLRISVQGTNSQMYKKHTGVNIDFNNFVENIAFFYKQSRGKCSIYIKIIEEELQDETDKEKFFALFGNICDEIFIENLVRAQPAMGNYDKQVESTRTFYGEKSQKRDVCPFIFYSLQIDSEGNCFPCPPLGLPQSFSLGNIKNIPLIGIWYGSKHKELMATHLRKDGNKCALCRSCTQYLCFTPEEDNVDHACESILHRLGV